NGSAADRRGREPMAATVAETANDFFKKLRRLWSAVVVGGEKSMMRLLVVIFGMAPASRPQGILQDISSLPE
ncbi:hypothetical protein A245_20246, partial [Pseudomonas syringae pv. actinidiae ICMP 19096]